MLQKIHKMLSSMTFAHRTYALIFLKFTHFEAQKPSRVVYGKIYLFHLKLRKNCLMLEEFKCDQHVFVHLFRKRLLFDINGSTEYLSIQMRTFVANLFQNNRCKSHTRR